MPVAVALWAAIGSGARPRSVTASAAIEIWRTPWCHLRCAWEAPSGFRRRGMASVPDASGIDQAMEAHGSGWLPVGLETAGQAAPRPPIPPRKSLAAALRGREEWRRSCARSRDRPGTRSSAPVWMGARLVGERSSARDPPAGRSPAERGEPASVSWHFTVAEPQAAVEVGCGEARSRPARGHLLDRGP